jgi:hypothetical protein
MSTRFFRVGLLATTLLASGGAVAHDQSVPTELKQFGKIPHAHSVDAPAAGARLWGNLGSLHFAITTSHPRAQAYFNEGLGSDLWLQPRRGAAKFPGGAGYRSGLRNVLLG